MAETLQEYIQRHKDLIEQYLKDNLTGGESEQLTEAMRYSVLNGGKRLRGILVISVYQAISGEDSAPDDLISLAAGIECIHAMSLVHDDLPCMDDDDLRRGQATCHKAYSESIALLTGDALLIKGMELCLSAKNIALEQLLQINKLIIESIGHNGMCAGQELDLYATGKEISLETLEHLHSCKTGALLQASALTGAVVANATESQYQAIADYAEKIGLAFQIIDDVLDIEGDADSLGKTPNKDNSQNKSTYPRILGLEESKIMARDLITQAKDILGKADIQSNILLDLADYIIERKG